MGLRKGQTNNLNGRPKKDHALTELLAKQLGKKIEVDGKLVSGNIVLSQLVAGVLLEGRLKFPNEKEESVVSVKDWLEFAKWAYGYLEPPVQKIAPTTPDGENPYMAIGADELIALAKRIADDSTTKD